MSEPQENIQTAEKSEKIDVIVNRRSGTVLRLGEDVVQGLTWEPVSKDNRIWITRGFVAVSAFCGGALTIVAPTDPLHLVLWALSLTGSSMFPILVLSVWWKRLTRQGAFFGVATGFAVAAAAIFAGEAGMIWLPSAIAGCIGLPVATFVAMTVSVAWPETSRHALEVVRDIRVPGGQIIYDREMQRLQLKRHSKS